jgi:hypothetical protein
MKLNRPIRIVTIFRFFYHLSPETSSVESWNAELQDSRPQREFARILVIISVRPLACVPVCNNSKIAERFFIKFDTGKHSNFVRIVKH